MSLGTVLKINFLVLALGVTVYSIYVLDHKGLGKNALSIFGLDSEKNGNHLKSLWKWCDTRVAGVIVPNQFKVTQKSQKWVYENAQEKTLDFISVEKWLANSCAVTAKLVSDADLNKFVPAVIVKFVNDKVEIIKKNDKDEYLWRNQVFKSPEFSAALLKLGQLPEAPIPVRVTK